MAAVLKPSANVFALLESNDPGDTRLADLGAPAKADAAATLPVNINKKQQPQMSVWKANKLKAEANAANSKPQKQPAAAPKAKTAAAANATGRNRKPPQQLAASKAQVTGAAANAGKNIKRPQQQQPAAASKAQQTYAAANTATNKPYQFQQQQQQQTPAPASLTQILFGNAYPSARVLIYKHRQEKLNALAKAKDGVAGGGAPAGDKKSGQPNAAAVKNAPAPVQEEPPAPVKPVLPPPPPPKLEDAAQFPSLK
ncbi:unnamed protein product [Urochloa humidicola]